MSEEKSHDPPLFRTITADDWAALAIRSAVALVFAALFTGRCAAAKTVGIDLLDHVISGERDEDPSGLS